MTETRAELLAKLAAFDQDRVQELPTLIEKLELELAALKAELKSLTPRKKSMNHFSQAELAVVQQVQQYLLTAENDGLKIPIADAFRDCGIQQTKRLYQKLLKLRFDARNQAKALNGAQRSSHSDFSTLSSVD